MQPRSSLFLFLIVACSTATSAQTVWDGPRISFSKTGSDDATLAENQDRITDDVWLTRGVAQGLYNAATEVQDDQTNSPAGTLWAVGTTDDLGSLTFDTWSNIFRNEIPGGAQGAPGTDFVVQLVDEQIYLDLQITAWSNTLAGVAVAYTRTTAIPEPASFGLLATLLMSAVARRRPLR